MSTEIGIVPATEQDAKDFAELTIVSNAQDRLFIYVCPHDRNATLTQQSEHLRWRTERMRYRMRTAGTHWFKAVDAQTGHTVGITGVIAPHCDKSGWTNEPSEAIDEAAFMECAQMTAGKRKELLGDREQETWYLASMAVHPDFQGQGIGRKLLAEICNLADKSSQDIYLEATSAGLKLYQKAGFGSLGEITLFEGEYRLTCMLRKPGSAL